MTKPIHISATQIDMFRQCPRKWAWYYIAKVPKEERRSTALGHKVHKILETYFKDGSAPDLHEEWSFKNDPKIFLPGRIASNMINAKTSKPGLAGVEYEFKIPDKSGNFFFVGKIDLIWYGNNTDTLFLVDHKTSVDPTQWGKRSEDLDRDIQAILYPWAGLYIYKYSDDIIFTLNYGATNLNNRKNMIVTRTFKPRDIKARFAEIIEPTAIKMVELKRKGVEPLKVSCNPSMCETYGGCDHKMRCNLTDKERIGAFMSGGSLIDDLLAESAEENGTETKEIQEGFLPDPVNPPEVAQHGQKDTIIAVGTGPISGSEILPPENDPKPAPKKQTRGTGNKKKKAEAPAEKVSTDSLDTIADAVADKVIDALVEKVLDRLAAKLRG